jgi:hypothetical protein
MIVGGFLGCSAGVGAAVVESPTMFCVSIFRPTVVRKGKREKTAVWWLCYRDDQGRVHRESTHAPDKQVARQVAGKRERELLLGLHGLYDPYAAQRLRPLGAHLKDYVQSLRDRGLSVGHITGMRDRLHRIWGDCKSISEIRKTKLESWLAGRRFSTSTRNHYLATVRAFVHWLIADRRLAPNDDPLVGMKKRSDDADRRYVRRALT